MTSFNLLKKSEKSAGRRGELLTRHGKIQTPFFMPIATVGAVKTLTFEDLETLEAEIILSNTYHLMLRPGMDLIGEFGDLHRFIHWSKAILTDSGGYQVFSLAKIRKITEEGVAFQSHIDGQKWLLTPEKAIEIQYQLGSDIMMFLDECVGNPAVEKEAQKAMELTQRWAERQIKSELAQKARARGQLAFGIVQGSLYPELRQKSARGLVTLNCDGYAIGGLAVGEKPAEMYQVLNYTVPELPEDKARYLMGVGKPEQILKAVTLGVDMFDCVIPTREARHGRLYLWQSEELDLVGKFYRAVAISNKRFKADQNPINPDSRFKVLREYSLSYLHHLFLIKEPLALRLATLNNVEFYLNLMRKIRQALEMGNL